MFVDRVRIVARAGNGGAGACSFLREKNRPEGGPDGGNGGQGGSVIIVVDPHVNNLIKYRYSPHQFAKNGSNGNRKQMSGRFGADCVIPVPPGTVVSRIPDEIVRAPLPEGERTPDDLAPLPDVVVPLERVADLVKPGDRFVLCAGGRGGRGNMNFKSSTNQAPRRYENGEEGERGQFQLELKSIADAGLVGYPNAGKSTLLSRISHAHPKIAPYPFTTLEPMIGVVEYPDFTRVTVADIPGLIEGAHEGVGLGHEFLRHIERCRMLLFVIDMAGSEGRDPRDDFAQLRKEISLYQKELGERPYQIIANKMDLPGAAENLKKFERKTRRKAIPISANEGQGLDELKELLKQELIGE
ncbi:MAG: GTPase ObgE [Methylacidiphilales bacterium]|nr:GTPase ObgE [Candidatus Methylacidiphilales bacterium]